MRGGQRKPRVRARRGGSLTLLLALLLLLAPLWVLLAVIAFLLAWLLSLPPTDRDAIFGTLDPVLEEGELGEPTILEVERP